MEEDGILKKATKAWHSRGNWMLTSHHVVQVVDSNIVESHKFQKRLEIFSDYVIHLCPLHQTLEYNILTGQTQVVTANHCQFKKSITRIS